MQDSFTPPVVTDSVVTDSFVTDSVVTDSVVTDSVVTDYDSEINDSEINDSDPVVTDSVVNDPVVNDPVVNDPFVTDSVVTDYDSEINDYDSEINDSDSVVTDSVVTDPVVTDPVVNDPVVNDPFVTDYVVTDYDSEINDSDPVVTDSVVTDSVVTDSVVTDSVVTDPEINDYLVTDPEINDYLVTEPEINDYLVTDPEINNPEINEPDINDPAFNMNWEYDMFPIDLTTLVSTDNFYHIVICDDFNKSNIVKYKQPNVIVFSQQEFIGIVNNINLKVRSVALMISTKDTEIINQFTYDDFYPLACLIRKINNGGLYIYNCNIGKYFSVRDLCINIDNTLQFNGGIMLSTDVSGDITDSTDISWMLDWKIQNREETFIQPGDVNEINRINDYITDSSKLKFHLFSISDAFGSFFRDETEKVITDVNRVNQGIANFFDQMSASFPMESVVCMQVNGIVQNMISRVYSYLTTLEYLAIDETLFGLALYKYYLVNLSNKENNFLVTEIKLDSKEQNEIWSEIVRIWSITLGSNEVRNARIDWSDVTNSDNNKDGYTYNRRVFEKDVNAIYTVIVNYFGTNSINNGVMSTTTIPAYPTQLNTQIVRIKQYILAAFNVQFKYQEYINVSAKSYVETLIGGFFITKWLIVQGLLVTEENKVIEINNVNDVENYIGEITATDSYNDRNGVNKQETFRGIRMTGAVGGATSYIIDEGVESVKASLVNKAKTLKNGVTYLPRKVMIAFKQLNRAELIRKLKYMRTQMSAVSLNGLKAPFNAGSLTEVDNLILKAEKVDGVVELTSFKKYISQIAKSERFIRFSKLASAPNRLIIMSSTKSKLMQGKVYATSSLYKKGAGIRAASTMSKFGKVGGATFAIFDVTATAMQWSVNNNHRNNFKNTFEPVAKKYDEIVSTLISCGDFYLEEIAVNEDRILTKYLPTDKILSRYLDINDKWEPAKLDGNKIIPEIPHTYKNSLLASFNGMSDLLNKKNDFVTAQLVIACFSAAAMIFIAVASFGIMAPLAMVGIAVLFSSVLTAASIVVTIAQAEYNISTYQHIASSKKRVDNLLFSDVSYDKVILQPIGINVLDSNIPKLNCFQLTKYANNDIYLQPLREEILCKIKDMMASYVMGSSIPILIINQVIPFMNLNYDYEEEKLYCNDIIKGISDIFNMDKSISTNTTITQRTDKINQFNQLRYELLELISSKSMRNNFVIKVKNGYITLYDAIYNSRLNYSGITVLDPFNNSYFQNNLQNFFSTRLKMRTSMFFAKKIEFKFQLQSSSVPYISTCHYDGLSVSPFSSINKMSVWTRASVTGSSEDIRLNKAAYNAMLNATPETTPVYQSFSNVGDIIIPELTSLPLFTVSNRTTQSIVINTKQRFDDSNVTELQYLIWKDVTDSTWSQAIMNPAQEIVWTFSAARPC